MEARNGWVTPLYKFNAQIGFRWSGITRLLPCPTSMLFFLRLVVLSSAGHESGQVFSPLQLSTIEPQFYAPTQHGEKELLCSWHCHYKCKSKGKYQPI
jgi:hypothetical protein